MSEWSINRSLRYSEVAHGEYLFFVFLVNTEWSKRSITVLNVENNVKINHNTRINYVASTHTHEPTFASPCIEPQYVLFFLKMC